VYRIAAPAAGSSARSRRASWRHRRDPGRSAARHHGSL